MTAHDTVLDPGASPYGGGAENYLNARQGLRSWLTTLDHKRIGVMYLISILCALMLGGIFAELIRVQLLSPKGALFTPERYNQIFTLHGAIMIFLFIIPGIPVAFGNFVLPMMLGAKDVAFPRLNLASWYIWIAGACVLLLSLVLGAADTGWTFYTPYSLTTNKSVVTTTFGVFILGFSSIFTGLNFIVTMHKLRPAGMNWYKMPLFLWAIYATAIIQVLATPVLAITLVLLIVERVFGVGIFDPALGGDPVLYQHFFWFYSHPAVYIMIVPAMGIVSEVISVFSRKHIYGYHAIAWSSVAIAVIGFGVWGHHMFVSGQSPLADLIFSALTFAVAIPSGVKVFNWIATMYKGSLRLDTPMLYILSFLFLFGIGGLTGLFLGSLATDVHLHDTYFVVAHFHYVMMGGTLIGFLAGLHYWWPKMFGRMYSEFWGRIAALVIFVGFNLTFFPQFVMGSQGMPRRYATYLPRFRPYHELSTAGAFLLAIGFIIIATYLIHSLVRGRPAPANPWGAGTLEWRTGSPPPVENFVGGPPAPRDPYDFTDLAWDPARGGYVERSSA